MCSSDLTDPRTTDSQKYVKEEETKILNWVEQEAARRKRREDQDKARALPKFELADRQSVTDAAVSGDGKYAYLVVSDRAQSRAGQVPRFVSESSYVEDIPGRTFVGDAQDRRRIASINEGDTGMFWERVQENQDPLKWCGAAPFYTFLRAMPSARGELLDYEHWQIDPQSVVTYGALR